MKKKELKTGMWVKISHNARAKSFVEYGTLYAEYGTIESINGDLIAVRHTSGSLVDWHWRSVQHV